MIFFNKYIFTYLKLIFFILIQFIFVYCNKNINNDTNGKSNDTTSHNISWDTDTIGSQYYNSFLYDVFAMNENNVWAVGEIHTEETDRFDSLGNWIPAFNVMKWDGNKIQLLRTNASGYGYYPNFSIFAFNDSNIWIGSTIPKLWNGFNWIFYGSNVGFPGGFGIARIFGMPNNTIYFVGSYGRIVRYESQEWISMESNTDVHLDDVWVVSKNDYTNNIIWACGFDDLMGSVLLRNSGQGFEQVVRISPPGIPHVPSQITYIFESLWSDCYDSVYIASVGRVYVAPKNTYGNARELIWWDYDNNPGYPPHTEIIRGNAANDFFIAGYTQFVRHYNGKSWKRYEILEGDGSWYGLSCFKNCVFIVGQSNGKAIFARGYR